MVGLGGPLPKWRLTAAPAWLWLSWIAKKAAAAVAALPPERQAQAEAFAADLRDEPAIEQMMQEIAAGFGRLDGVVNNAAMLAADDGNAIDTPLASWQATLDVNLTGAFLVYKYALPQMLAQGHGSLVTMSSVVAHSASAVPQIAYTTSKGALEAMTPRNCHDLFTR